MDSDSPTDFGVDYFERFIPGGRFLLVFSRDGKFVPCVSSVQQHTRSGECCLTSTTCQYSVLRPSNVGTSRSDGFDFLFAMFSFDQFH